jgi:NAD(P)-dependent dehydrogenase (short-subunit alcohol dehydrogenase family)
MNVLVLGGSGGIGKEVIKKFTQTKGNFIYYTYTSWNREVQELEDYIINSGNCPSAIHYIIGDPICGNFKEDVIPLIPQLGKIDYFINCIGVIDNKKLEHMTINEIISSLNINLCDVVNNSKMILQHMKVNGCIINIGSIVGEIGFYGETIYSTSKAGLEGFTKSLAMETAKQQIRVILVVPSIVDTDIFKNLTNEQRNILAERTLFKRFATPEEIAKLIYFICIDGTFFSGEIIPITNGFH